MSDRTRTTPEWTEHWDEIAHRVDRLLHEGQEVEFVGGALVVFSQGGDVVRRLERGMTKRDAYHWLCGFAAADAARERHYPILAYVGGEYACVFPSGHCETKR